MNKNVFYLIVAFFCITANAQNQVPATNNAGQSNEYSSAWNALTQLGQSKQYPQAIQQGLRLSKMFSQGKKYKEAFATCREMDGLIRTNEKETNQPNYKLRYEVAKERLRLYTNLKNLQNCKMQLNVLQSCASQIKSPALNDEVLLTEAGFYQAFGMNDQSQKCYKLYVSQKTAGKDKEGIDKCYKDLLAYAEQNQNPAMTSTVTDLYSSWKRSIQQAKDAEQYKSLQEKYDDSQQTIQDKDKSITAKWVMIGFLGVLAAALAIGIVVLLGLLFKQIHRAKKLAKSLNTANENNELKSRFIENMKGQIEPALNTIAETRSDAERKDNINALKNLMTDIQTYLATEKTRDELYPAEELEASALCEKVMGKVKEELKPGIETLVNAPRLEIKANAEVLEKILSDLLIYFGEQEGTAKVILEFKKRSAHSGQFILTDHGFFIPEEDRENIFKPFARIQDVTQGNILLLPTSSLIAGKLNGTLSFDNEYRKGTRFILQLHED